MNLEWIINHEIVVPRWIRQLGNFKIMIPQVDCTALKKKNEKKFKKQNVGKWLQSNTSSFLSCSWRMSLSNSAWNLLRRAALSIAAISFSWACLKFWSSRISSRSFSACICVLSTTKRQSQWKKGSQLWYSYSSLRFQHVTR